MTTQERAVDQPRSGEDIGAAMDAVNLERALIDFEIANARVIDLTARLTEFSRDLLAARSELGLAKLRISELELQAAELAELKSSRAYRTARILGNARASVRADVGKLLRK
jgi:hypothetical protein